MIREILNIDFKEIDKHLDPSIKANLIFADPPYRSGKDQKNNIRCDMLENRNDAA